MSCRLAWVSPLPSLGARSGMHSPAPFTPYALRVVRTTVTTVTVTVLPSTIICGAFKNWGGGSSGGGPSPVVLS